MAEDFGTFVTEMPDNVEDLVRDCMSKAKRNFQRPGQQFMRVMIFDMDLFGYHVEGHSAGHVDLHAGTVTWTEIWGGVVTARRTEPLPR